MLGMWLYFLYQVSTCAEWLC